MNNPGQFSPYWKRDIGSRAEVDLANDANQLSAALRGSTISGTDSELVSNMDKLSDAQRMCSVSGTGACPLNNTNQFSASFSLRHPEPPHMDFSNLLPHSLQHHTQNLKLALQILAKSKINNMFHLPTIIQHLFNHSFLHLKNNY